MDVLCEPYRDFVKAIMAEALCDIARGHRARRFQMPVLGNRHLAMVAYDEYLQKVTRRKPERFSRWYAVRRERASIHISWGEDAIEALSAPELRELCSLADVYVPPNCTEAVELVCHLVECGEM